MPGNHKRNTTAMQQCQRCGAKTRGGTPCKSPAVVGKSRCRMHGGAKGSGAPKGNKNAFIHGTFSQAYREYEKYIRECLREGNAIVNDLWDT